MPRLIDCEDDGQCELGECFESLAQIGFDPNCEEATFESARWLRRLASNREFLGDLLIDQLRNRDNEYRVESGYGPQAIVLSPMREKIFLRANIWPASQDHCFVASGARNFVYGVPHDHNFSFLTCGYFGPGYKSDYYEYDYEKVVGYEGEPVDLRFVERSALHQGKLMLYRAHVDVHSQIPPDSLSVSLNIIHVDPAQEWFDQYGFDLEDQKIAKILSPSSSETFLRLAVGLGGEEAFDLAEQIGRSHPSDRLRLASFEARARAATDTASRDELWREAELSGSLLLAQCARRERGELEAPIGA